MSTLLIVLVSFALMEPITAAVHRWVMHGFGAWLHRSHHRRHRRPGWEANDVYPVVFAAIVMVAFWLSFNGPRLAVLLPVGIGITAYGLAYALVHDAYIHRRLPVFGTRRLMLLDRLAEAHRIHHLYGGAPYGMLVPVVPADLRSRAARSSTDPFAPLERHPAET